MTTRKPAVAGRFYPAAPEILQKNVDACLDEAAVSPNPEDVCVVIAPHAGYRFSGATAGHAFRRVQGMHARRAILLGPSHHYRFDGIAVDQREAWETPLGRVPIDQEFATRLVEAFGSVGLEAHEPEHALEVEVPFLQSALAPGFTIVPILFGGDNALLHRQIAGYLAETLASDDLIIASTDLSHFLPESEANRIDRHSMDLVLAGDEDQVQREVQAQTCAMCGAAAVFTALTAANALGATQRTVWDYRTSARASGDFRRVVGYGALTLEGARAA